MAATSDDDVPKVATATGHDDNADGDTTAAAAAPATSAAIKSPIEDDEEDDEDRTVQQPVDPKVRTSVREPAVPPPPKGVVAPPPRPVAPGPPAPPVRITSKKMTAVGLGAPPPVTRPAAGFEPPPPMAPPPPPPPPPKRDPSTEAEEADDSITATAPAPRMKTGAANLPLAVPGSVKITEIPDIEEPLDETEVRTVVTVPGEPPPPAPAPAPASAVAASPAEDDVGEADEPDDSVTTQAPSPIAGGHLPEEDEPKTSPPMLAPPSPAAGRMVATAAQQPPDDEEGDAYDNDESVTTRGPVIGEYDEEDSVTAQAPVTRASGQLPSALQHPPIFDETDGTTKKVPKREQVPVPPPPGLEARADGDAPSVTSEAPAGHLSNMLRVIAVPTTGLEGDPLDDSAELHTAVMINAPPRPAGAAQSGSRGARPPMVASGPLGGGVAAIADLRAELREPSSDSGLRVARAEAPSGDHASLGSIMAGAALAPTERADHGSGVGPIESSLVEPPPVSPYANTEQAAFGPHRGRQPSLREFDFAASTKKPRYGLIVGIVATLSFAIPLLLFLWLHSNAVVEMMPRERSELAPDPIVRADPPRPKATSSSSAKTGPSGHPGQRSPANRRR